MKRTLLVLLLTALSLLLVSLTAKANTSDVMFPDKIVWENITPDRRFDFSELAIRNDLFALEYVLTRDLRIESFSIMNKGGAWAGRDDQAPKVWLTLNSSDPRGAVLAELIPPDVWDLGTDRTQVWNTYRVPRRIELDRNDRLFVHIEAVDGDFYLPYTKSHGATRPPSPTENGLRFVDGYGTGRSYGCTTYDANDRNCFNFSPGVLFAPVQYPTVRFVGGEPYEDPDFVPHGCGAACKFLWFGAVALENSVFPGHDGQSVTVWVWFEEPLPYVSERDIRNLVRLSCGRVTDITKLDFGHRLDGYWIDIDPCNEDLTFSMRSNQTFTDHYGRQFSGAPAITIEYQRPTRLLRTTAGGNVLTLQAQSISVRATADRNVPSFQTVEARDGSGPGGPSLSVAAGSGSAPACPATLAGASSCSAAASGFHNRPTLAERLSAAGADLDRLPVGDLVRQATPGTP